MKRAPLLLPVIVASLLFLIGIAPCQLIRLPSFTPLLALILLRYDFRKALISAALFGLIFDLFSADPPFGQQIWSFVLATAVMTPLHRYFFEDKLISFGLMTAFLSLIQASLLLLIRFSPPFDRALLTYDLLLGAALDGVHAICCFLLPMRLWLIIHRWRLRLAPQ